MFLIYENPNFYFFWKPHGLPSTFGKEKSFLDCLEEGNLVESINISDILPFQKYFDLSLKKVENTNLAITHQIQTFTKEQEFGLLNRLDNETAGFLYFAKDLTIFDSYRQLQADNKVEKHYIAQVIGKYDIKNINYPIMHRSSLKMIAIKSPTDLKKGRGKEHNVETFITTIDYDPKSNISTLLVKIHKGIRHQIRVHLASVGFPIIGDPLYGKSGTDEILHLRSVGFNAFGKKNFTD